MRHTLPASICGIILATTACGQAPEDASNTTDVQPAITITSENLGDPNATSEANDHRGCAKNPQDPNGGANNPNDPAIGDPGTAVDGNGRPVPHPDGPAADPNRSPESPNDRGCDPNGW